eukprot:365116-Chlamydomonas_euryale.AAC.5
MSRQDCHHHHTRESVARVERVLDQCTGGRPPAGQGQVDSEQWFLSVEESTAYVAYRKSVRAALGGDKLSCQICSVCGD